MRLIGAVPRASRAGAAVLMLLTVATACASHSASPAVTGTSHRPAPPSAAGHDEHDYDEQLAKDMGLSSPPQVKPVRTVAAADQSSVIASCMAAAGFMQSSGAYSVPEQQRRTFSLQLYTCNLEYPAKPDPRAAQPLTGADLDRFYDFVIKTEIPCIEAFGFSITGIPSRATFKATFDSDPFYPMAEVWPQLHGSEATNAFIAKIEDSCPQWPSDDQLYGSS